jgi:DNA-binding winged helix-turn-helix (wHTH) protein
LSFSSLSADLPGGSRIVFAAELATHSRRWRKTTMHCGSTSGEPLVNAECMVNEGLGGRAEGRVYIRPMEVPVAQPAPGRARLRFENYELDLRARELYKDGHRIKLQEQPFQILAILLEHPGEVVSRDDLRQNLWKEDTFVDFDHSLNTAVKKLRQALNDEADNPRFIETLPRRGYRFIGRIGETPSTGAPAQNPAAGAEADFVGGVFTLRDEGTASFVCLPVDEASLAEKEKLEAADDNLGLSLLAASEKLLLVRVGTRLKVLEGLTSNSCYEARLLEGEHTAKTVVVQRKYLSSGS